VLYPHFSTTAARSAVMTAPPNVRLPRSEIRAGNPCRDAAHQLSGAGVSSVPILLNGQKKPAVEWKIYQTRIPTARDIDALYRHPRGIAVVGGSVSGNLEILDFDDPTAVPPWRALVDHEAPGLVGRLVVAKTPSGGAHYYYRHDDTPAGNQKLAMALMPDDDGLLIPKARGETRGEGGYAVVSPSPGACHPSGRPYLPVRGSLTALPVLTCAERRLLLDAARAQATWTPPPISDAPHTGTSVVGHRPGDDFNTRARWSDILERHGWRAVRSRGDEIIWRRPGKRDGQSATTGYDGRAVLYVFSSNAHPFEPGRGYTRFTAYAVLEHGGDYKEAARALAAAGYGDQLAADGQESVGDSRASLGRVPTPRRATDGGPGVAVTPPAVYEEALG